MNYSYGLPGWLIWSLHIIIGFSLLYLGRIITNGEPLPTYIGLAFVALGAIQVAYHSHLWYLNRK